MQTLGRTHRIPPTQVSCFAVALRLDSAPTACFRPTFPSMFGFLRGISVGSHKGLRSIIRLVQEVFLSRRTSNTQPFCSLSSPQTCGPTHHGGYGQRREGSRAWQAREELLGPIRMKRGHVFLIFCPRADSSSPSFLPLGPSYAG